MSSTGRLRLAAAAAVLATAAGLHLVVQGAAWYVQVVLAVVVVAAAGAAASALRLPAWAGALAQPVALVVVLCVLFVPGQAVLGLLPGPEALRALWALAQEGRETIRSQAAPVVAEPGLRLLVTAGAGAVAVVIDLVAVALRSPALTGPVLLAVHAVAVVFAPGGVSWGWFALAVAAWLLLLAADAGSRAAAWGRRVQQRRPGPASGRGAGGALGLTGAAGAVAVAVVALVAAVVVPPLVPGTTSVVLVGGNGQGIGGAAANSVNPLLDLRSDLESQGTAEVLRYRTSAVSPVPLRIVTVDDFDGDVWRPTAIDPSQTRALRDGMPAVPGLAEGTPTTDVTYDVTVQALRQQWLPTPYPARQVQVDGDWVVDTSTLNIRAQGRTATQEDQEYQVVQAAVAPTPEQLRDAPAPPADVVERYTALPEDLPPQLRETALQVVGGETSPFLQASELQQWFRTTGGFSYSLEAPEPRSANALVDFLADKTGYCVHYASAMAVMARTLGIPARVAVGFLPGATLGDGSWQVTLQDAHAWPELYFEGAGWVRFEPTPSARTGTAPAWTQAPVTPVVPSAPVDGSSASAAAPSSTTSSSASPTSSATTAPGAQQQDDVPWSGLLVALAVVLGVLAAPLASRSLVRRRRWRRAGSEAARAEAAWADLVEQIGDLGVSLPPSRTPRQVGASLREGLAGEGEHSAQAQAVARLVGAVEGARYGAPADAERRSGRSGGRAGPGGGTALAEDVREVVGAVVAQRPGSATWRWRLLPPSGVAHLRRWGRALVRRG
ncbi:transglutaminase family protein [Quadrisphaera sp. KR29]|uniref:transglutaminase family protein n=1 Tax=Quadrisphaera sp. KR29 TaxID=3461391 RepID=UPI0040443E20